MSNTFPVFEVRGTPRQRGQQLGEVLRERIAATFDYYMDDLFAGVALSGADIRARAARIRALTERYAPALLAEIEGIAEGSALDPWKLLVLNARTEILNARIDECTALWFGHSRVLAQNWDWLEPLEALSVVVRHRHPDGHQHVTFCEPGMVGKIGMNSAGIGVCLNILFAPHRLTGLPVHILIGAVLSARSFTEAETLLHNCGAGKASHLLVAAADGDAVSKEFFGDEVHTLAPKNDVLLHTNHCLGRGVAGRTTELANSCARYDQVADKVATASTHDLTLAKSILLDTSGGENAIMRAYREQDTLGSQRVGTCACILMELAAGRMHLRRGPGSTDDFTGIDLTADTVAA